MSKEIYCPNCQQLAIKEGNEITCENCDSVFSVTKTGPAKVKDMGRLKTLEERVDRHDNLLQGLLPEPDPAKTEPDPAKTEPDPTKTEPDPARSDSLLG